MPFPDIDPVIFSVELFGVTLALRWYALAYIAGLIAGWQIMARMMKRPALWPNNTAPMTPQQPEDLLTWMILGVVIGGRLGFVLFYQPAYYFANPVEIVMIQNGGMSFHGGFAGVIVAGLIWARCNGVPAWQLGDAVALVAPIGLCLGRIANFINGELWGRVTDVPWGVVFPSAEAQICPPEVLAAVCARHPSQLYQAGLEGLVLFAVLAYLAFRRGALKRPGTLIGVFFIGYGIARSFVELFRQPDAQFVTAGNPLGHVIALGEMGLTMGQVLSLPLIVIGVIILRMRPKHDAA
ncbi:phosphatidylglycerol:prolipoprotein diacylglycerol transferase [Rubricella aquisinus]|uniref:Phosphatidylglycerol--prolipoprotein diacylglyceryl transferase n=1 Tax=Rubricella aquisinus TaxID=2028108 RepID=A0A840WNC2_9RHOB|nr:prolipoprotein diacylglyceryl transferase [Rubricella aquisinus]MBB5515593.1 phosphatidylglycerol:prolipoprotein diacylglycerol transferase [Rubricella aquisinus]